jgi:hypothetical protein
MKQESARQGALPNNMHPNHTDLASHAAAFRLTHEIICGDRPDGQVIA